MPTRQSAPPRSHWLAPTRSPKREKNGCCAAERKTGKSRNLKPSPTSAETGRQDLSGRAFRQRHGGALARPASAFRRHPVAAGAVGREVLFRLLPVLGLPKGCPGLEGSSRQLVRERPLCRSDNPREADWPWSE